MDIHTCAFGEDRAPMAFEGPLQLISREFLILQISNAYFDQGLREILGTNMKI